MVRGTDQGEMLGLSGPWIGGVSGKEQLECQVGRAVGAL